MNNTISKITLLFCGLFLVWNMQAQVGAWKTYMAYHQATIVVETPHLVFGVYDGSLLSYNPEDGEIRTYSRQQGLNDTDITQMAYHPEAKALILIYRNANIDIFLGENDVYNLSFVKDYPYIQDKTINNLEITGDYAYISTAFGIVVVDVKRKVVKETYRFGFYVYSVCQNDNYLYAATSEGVKRGLLSTNLIALENWESYGLNAESFKSIHKIFFFKDRFVFRFEWNQVHYLDSEGEMHSFGYTNVRNMKILNDQLVLITSRDLYFYSDFSTYTRVSRSAYSIDCINSKNQYWLASGEDGLTGFTKLPNTSEYNITASEIKVNSPKRNLNAYMTFEADKLLITGGGRGADRFNVEGTLMVYEDGKWYNFNDKEIAEKTGLPCLDFMSVAVDPLDPNHYYVGSWGEGLYEFQNNEFVKLYSSNNSSLQTAIEGNNRFIRVDGLVFDKDNNLYMINGNVTNGLSIFLNQKEWKNFHYRPLATYVPNKILISSNNQKWINILRGEAGIMVLDEKGTIGDASDDQYAFSGNFVDQQGNDVKASAYLSMAEDHNGLIWVGTDNGPVYFTSAGQVDQGICYRMISADQYDEGYRPLEGIRITAIAVDGGNRKWMGSAGSGIFVVDQSKGSEIEITNYTAENSFLLSNTINSIAIDGKTGEVFIGTDRGLCSYRSEAIDPNPNYSDVYVYPNPVRPANHSQVVITGLMQNSTVKITDMAGNLIKEGVSMGGQFLWNCADRTGAIVKAGIYLVFATTPDGNQGVVTKIMVIK